MHLHCTLHLKNIKQISINSPMKFYSINSIQFNLLHYCYFGYYCCCFHTQKKPKIKSIFVHFSFFVVVVFVELHDKMLHGCEWSADPRSYFTLKWHFIDSFLHFFYYWIKYFTSFCINSIWEIRSKAKSTAHKI